MAYTYKGTKVTGTGTAAKKGHAAKKANETYFNTETGHVYKSTKKGKKTESIWKYNRTDIAKKPSLQVNLKAPVRTDGRVMKATWTTPADMLSDKKGDRATGLTIDWYLGIPGVDPKRVTQTGNESLKESSINLDGVTAGGVYYNRLSFYPRTGKPKLTYVTCAVAGKNSKGTGTFAKQTRQFTPPKKPSIGNWQFDAATGIVSATITTDPGEGYAERYDTRYKITIVNTHTNRTWTHRDTDSTSTSIDISYNASGYQSLDPGDYIAVVVEAWARGYAGDSDHVDDAFYVSYPRPATVNPNVSVSAATGKANIKINTNTSAAHPVDQVRLGYLPNVAYEKASDIPDGADWTWTDIVDDGKCTALSLPLRGLSPDPTPDPGKHTWICVKSWHASEAVLFMYSQYVEIKDLFVPASTAVDDDITILDATAGTDGESAVVWLGWNKSGTDDNTGTELTWSDELDTWKSTKSPDSFEFAWSDGQITHEGVTYHDSATITIKGLNEGTKYYIKARRYLEDDVTTYSEYSNTADVITSETPETIVATCDRYVPTGSSLQIYWTFAANGAQTEWQIVDTNGTVLASGEGSAGAAQIGSDRLKSFATDNSITFTVQASAGSGFVVSEPHTVTVIDNPELAVTAYDTVRVQPFSFETTSSRLCDLQVIITSQGASGQRPQGICRQVAGDTIYSDIISPKWTVENDELWASNLLPPGLDLWDGGHYTLSVTAIDRETGLRSEEIQKSFAIDWTHKAPDPTEYVTLTPLNYMDDENDMHHQAVQIDLTPPEAALSSDLYDIYRLTGDGAQLIGESFPLTCTTTDEYAPFGDDLTCYYRIALRTADGDVSFADIEYNLDGSSMRFDWAGGVLELPYNLSIADTYKKDVDIRKHMDGSTDGYWNQNIERTGSLSSDAIRLDQQTDIIAARHLARYPNAAFVRTPDGSAYEADVQVTDLSTEGAITAIAIDATEIGLTQEFILPSPYILEEPQTEGE